MIRKILLLAALTSSVFSYAQKKAKPETFANSITAEGLKKQLYIVAGPDMEGRETATEGQRKAAAYIESYFKKLKLQPGDSGKYQMAFPVYQDSITSAAFSIAEKKFAFTQDFSIAGTGIPTGDFTISNIVFAGKGIKDSTHNDYD